MESHIRIDEGVKRGRKQQRSPLAPIDPDDVTRSPAIPHDLDPKAVLELYLQYPTTSGIAQRLGVRRSTLTLWLRDTCPRDWRNVQIARALIRKEDADEGLQTAQDALALARAREMLRSGQWDLERLDGRNYGQQVQITHEIGGTLAAALERTRQREVGADLGVSQDVSDAVIVDNQEVK